MYSPCRVEFFGYCRLVFSPAAPQEHRFSSHIFKSIIDGLRNKCGIHVNDLSVLFAENRGKLTGGRKSFVRSRSPESLISYSRSLHTRGMYSNNFPKSSIPREGLLFTYKSDVGGLFTRARRHTMPFRHEMARDHYIRKRKFSYINDPRNSTFTPQRVHQTTIC